MEIVTIRKNVIRAVALICALWVGSMLPTAHYWGLALGLGVGLFTILEFQRATSGAQSDSQSIGRRLAIIALIACATSFLVEITPKPSSPIVPILLAGAVLTIMAFQISKRRMSIKNAFFYLILLAVTLGMATLTRK